MDNIKNLIPAYLKDARLNCAVLIEENSPIELKSRLYIAIASSVALRSPRLSEALLTEIKAAGLDEKLYEAAVQAGSLMAMNNIYYGTRGLLPLEISGQLPPPRLRMNAIMNHGIDKHLFELMCLAASTVGKCKDCLSAHAASILKSGGSVDQINDAIRIAAVTSSIAAALELV